MKRVAWEKFPYFPFSSSLIFPPQQVLPEEVGCQKGAYYNPGGDQRVGRWREEERVIQLVTSNGSQLVISNGSDARLILFAAVQKPASTTPLM